MKPARFAYHAPETVEEAVGLLAQLGDEAKVLAGGQSLVPMLSLRLTTFEHLVDVSRISSLCGVSSAGGGVRIGAATTERAVERSADVAAGAPLMARATPFIGHFQIRNRGTVGGSIAHADPAAEYPAVALALDASVEAASVRGTRTIAAADLFTGVWSTALEPDELLVAATFPTWSGRCGFAVEEQARRHGDFAIAGAVVGVELDAHDRVARCAIALVGMGSTPIRCTGAEAGLVGGPLGAAEAEAAGHAAVAGTAPPADLHASAEHRRRVGAVLVRRALMSAAEEARSGS